MTKENQTQPMEDQDRHTIIQQQTNNNCQQFFGPVSNCVFAMPGSHVTQTQSSTSQVSSATKPSFDQDDLSDEQWEEIQKVFKGPRSIISILRAMIADCLKPADYACMIAVLDDFGLVRDRYDFAGITNALAILGRNVEPNSIRYKLNQLPSDFRSWDKTQFKSDYSFCSSLELHIKDIPGYTYRY